MSCGIKKQKVPKQRGGSPASDLVMANLADLSSSQSVPQGCALKGDMNSLNLYQPSGGARRSRSHSRNHSRSRKSAMLRKGSKSRKTGRKGLKSRKGKKGNKGKKSMKSNKRNSKSGMRIMKGGSDWIASQYSQGPINNPVSTGSNLFSVSEPSDRDVLNNPPTLGLAGSGGAMGALEGANVRNVGAPLV